MAKDNLGMEAEEIENQQRIKEEEERIKEEERKVREWEEKQEDD